MACLLDIVPDFAARYDSQHFSFNLLVLSLWCDTLASAFLPSLETVPIVSVCDLVQRLLVCKKLVHSRYLSQLLHSFDLYFRQRKC